MGLGDALEMEKLTGSYKPKQPNKNHDSLMLKTIVEEFLGWKDHSDDPNRPESFLTHRCPQGGWYSIPDYLGDNRDEIWNLIDILREKAWVFTYSNMSGGVWGHYVKIGYLQSLFHSFHNYTTGSGDTFERAVVSALYEALIIQKKPR